MLTLPERCGDLSSLINIHGTVTARVEFDRLVVRRYLVETTARIYSVFRSE